MLAVVRRLRRLERTGRWELRADGLVWEEWMDRWGCRFWFVKEER